MVEWLKSAYDVTQTLFLYKFVFMAEIFSLELLLGSMLDKKPRFLLRAVLTGAVLFVVTFALPVAVYESWYLTILFIMMFLASSAMMKLLYAEPYKNLLVAGVFAYSAQHFSYSLSSFIVNALTDSYYSVYSKQTLSSGDIRSFVVSVCSFLFVFGVIFVYLLLRANKKKGLKADNLFLVAIAGVMIIANVVLNAVAVYEFEKEFSRNLFIVFSIYDIITALMVMWLLVFSVSYNGMRDEMKIISVLRSRERQTYDAKKEKIDAINEMCHDLRHQIEKLRKKEYDAAVIGEMEQSVSRVSVLYKTGNDVLDVVIRENLLVCDSFGIRLVCIADGKSLNGIPEAVLFSIFDNLLNNAVDAVRKIKSHDKYIKLIVNEAVGGIVSIIVENPREASELRFEDGIPLSSGGGLHGYGLRSVTSAVEALGGAMTITAEESVFIVNIVLPEERRASANAERSEKN